MVDRAEKENILAHAELIQRCMDPHQEKDARKWFDGEVEEDPDFPSGRCEGTMVTERGCNFLDSRGLCVLQKAALSVGMDKWELKPYFCVSFPLTIETGVLTVSDAEFTNRPVCCSTISKGDLVPIEVCREELEFMLGKDGLTEIDNIYRQRR